mgnify:CR=1 FL=1
MRKSFFADATSAPTNDDRTDATIDHTIKRTVTSIEGARDGSHRRGARSIVATTKIGERDAAPRRLSTTGSATPAINVNKRQQRHRFTNKYSGASR